MAHLVSFMYALQVQGMATEVYSPLADPNLPLLCGGLSGRRLFI